MKLARLYGRAFRNLEELSWRPSEGAQLLLGDNGAGKTSLLEAVYVLATTRSFRASRLGECTRHDARGFQLGGTAVGETEVDLEISFAADGLERRLNGGPATLKDHLAALPVVSWTAADLEWIGGAPRERRRLIDRGLVGLKPGAIDSLARYRRALDQKRELLARGGSELATWNEVLAAAADELIRQRREHVARLGAALGDVLAEGDLELPEMSLIYRSSPAEGGHGVAQTLAALDEARSRELERGAPLVGPHRDELEIRWGSHTARRVASAGESKLLGLAITAARARLLTAADRAPVLLLDDLDAELDSRRLAVAWSFFEGFEQILVTSNRASVWEPFGIESSWFLTCGKLSPL